MANAPTTVNLKDYQAPGFLIPEVTLHFELGENETIVRSELKIEKNPASSAGNSLFLNGEGLELVTIKLDGNALTKENYQVSDNGLTIPEMPDKARLEIATRIYPQNNKSFSGLYKTSTVFCTQMEAEGFRNVTYFLDRPDVLSVYTTEIVANKTKYPILLSNGNLHETKDLGNNLHRVKWSDPFPKPCYLFALVAGDLDWVEDTYLTTSKKKVDLKVYVDKGKADRARFAMDCLKQSMKWDEDTYGLEYDLSIYNIVAVDDFNMGAMENKGLNVFNSKYVLADTHSATDDEFTGILRVIGHEYFHNWSGNRVTCRDWFQLSLKEGLTVYRDQEFTCDLTSRDVKRIEDVDLLRSRQFPEDEGPMAHPVRPNSYISIDNFYTMTVYHKGAEVIRMMEHILGQEMFKKGVSKYFELHDGQAVTTDDFVAALESVSGKDLGQFKRWYDQAGTPEVSVSSQYYPDKQSFEIELTQKTIHPVSKTENQPYHIPIQMGLVNEKGSAMEFSVEGQTEKTTDFMFELKETQQKLTLSDVGQKPVLSMLRGFSAPIKMNFEQPDDELSLLMTKDSDPFNRWDATQKIYLNTLKGMYSKVLNGEQPEFPEALSKAMANIVENGVEYPALAAKLLQIPSQHYVMQFIEDMDPEALCKTYEFFHTTLSKEIHSSLLGTYDLLKSKNLSTSQDDVGMRAFKNKVLHSLCHHDSEQGAEIASSQFHTATNMTDQLAALYKLSKWDHSKSTQALGAFYDKWKGDRLVINKWLTVQALSRREKAFENIQTLLKDPVYDNTNPNNIFALLYNFANDNWHSYHRPQNNTYSWMAQQILDIDGRNPQVASRLVSHFNSWKKFAPKYQTPMKAALTSMSEQKTSKNLFEIVDRALNS